MSDPVTELRGLLGEEVVGDAEPDLVAHSADWTPEHLLAARRGAPAALPSCVVRPESTEQVAELLRWAAATATPVVPFGGGSGVCGGIRPAGAVVVDMGGMWRILDIDDKSLIAKVEAGVTGPQLTEALDTGGHMLGHEPQSIGISTVGGWVATKACGQLSARYGGIEDLLLGLEAVLPGGKIVRSKVVPRRSTGPDVASLMVGSEGTLGIVTAAALGIAHKPRASADRCIRFDHMADGVAACRRLAQSDLRPTLVRLYDAEDAMLFLRHHPDEPPGPLLLLAFDGDDCDRRADAAEALADGAPGTDGLVAHWFEHRNDAVEEFRNVMQGTGLLGPHAVVDTMEVSGTWSGLRSLYHSMKQRLGAQADLVACHLSHVYPQGACLYFTLGSACSDEDQAAETLARWWDTGMQACLDEGGSISHHHGIGRVKAPWLESELGGWHEILRTVKASLDPGGIMNPGALGL